MVSDGAHALSGQNLPHRIRVGTKRQNDGILASILIDVHTISLRYYLCAGILYRGNAKFTAFEYEVLLEFTSFTLKYEKICK